MIDTTTIAPIASQGLQIFDKAKTADLLPFGALVHEIAQAAAEYEAGQIVSPERMVVPLGSGGVLLSMPATASDIGIHKLANVQPANAQLQLPTIHGTVTVCEAATGKPLCVLDGPEVTGRRTAAVTLLAIRTFLPQPPASLLLYGTGAQARYHVKALRDVYPQCQIWVRGLNEQVSADFCASFGDAQSLVRPCSAELPTEIDVVVTVTTSTEPIYDELARSERLVVGVGAFKPEMAEIGKTTLDGSQIFADDPVGARHEAGDLLRAGVDWSKVHSLAGALRGEREVGRPVVFKSVGTGAWDLAAARVALKSLKS